MLPAKIVLEIDSISLEIQHRFIQNTLPSVLIGQLVKPMAVVNEIDPPLRCLPLSITQEAWGYSAGLLRTQKRVGSQYHHTPP
jgi:hypothetical protein